MNNFKTLFYKWLLLTQIVFSVLSLGPHCFAQEALTDGQIIQEYQKFSQKLDAGFYGKGSIIIENNLLLMGNFLLRRNSAIKSCQDLEMIVSELQPGDYQFQKGENKFDTSYCLPKKILAASIL